MPRLLATSTTSCALSLSPIVSWNASGVPATIVAASGLAVAPSAMIFVAPPTGAPSLARAVAEKACVWPTASDTARGSSTTSTQPLLSELIEDWMSLSTLETSSSRLACPAMRARTSISPSASVSLAPLGPR